MSDLYKVRGLLNEFVAGAADIEVLVQALEIIEDLIGETAEVVEDDAPEVSSDADEVAVDPVA